MARVLCVARRTGPRVCLLALAVLVGSGCTASSAASKPKRAALRTDDLPPPRRPPPPPPPSVALAAAHAEPDLVNDAPVPTARAPVARGRTSREARKRFTASPGPRARRAALAELNGIAVATPLAVGQRDRPRRPTTDPTLRRGALAGLRAAPRSATAPPRAPRDASWGGECPRACRGLEAVGSDPEADPVMHRPPASGAPSRVGSHGAGLPLRLVVGRAAPATPWPGRGCCSGRCAGCSTHASAARERRPTTGSTSRPRGDAGPTAGEGSAFRRPGRATACWSSGASRGLGPSTPTTAIPRPHRTAVTGGTGHRHRRRIRKTSGPHLHFEVRQDGEPVDPQAPRTAAGAEPERSEINEPCGTPPTTCPRIIVERNWVRRWT